MDKTYRYRKIRMKFLHKEILVLLAILIGIVFSPNAYAVPAAPIIHTLMQPDGVEFKANQWGDEWSHGWQTEEGYTIIFDVALNRWIYAVLGSDGKLISSYGIVGRDLPPQDAPKFLRPTAQRPSPMPSFSALEPKPLSISAPEKAVQSTGTANIPVILVNFNDRVATYTNVDFNTLLFGTGNYSMKDYYEEVSYGKFSVSAGPGGIAWWYTTSNIHDYYGQNDTSSGNDMWPGDLVYEAVSAADAAGFNFAPYDQNGDCYVDVVNIIHQGTGEESSGVATDLWSHRWNLSNAQYYGRSHYGEYTTNDACLSGGFIKVNDYVIQPEKFPSGVLMTVGVFAHEYGHALGLPDLYDTDYSSEGIGKWSLMAGGAWNTMSVSGDRPAHLDAWSKIKLEWVKPTLPASRTITIPQVETNKYIYQLCSSTQGQEYFLLENRQRTGFDTYLPGDGLAIYHIDEGVDSNDNEWYPGCPTCISHYKVALEQADGLWDLEKNINAGDGGDLFPGTTNNKSFNNRSVPDSKNYAGQSTGASVTKISTSNATMTAIVSASSTTASFAISPYTGGLINSSDVAFDGTNYFVVWSDGRNGYYNIYGSRITPCGKVLDPGGIAISTGLFEEMEPAIAFDGKNYLIVWQDYRGGFGTSNIYGTIVNPSGQVITPGDFPITVSSSYEVAPSLAFDGSNYLVIWSDTRYDINNGVIMGARVTPNGAVLDPSAILISPILAGQNQTHPSVAFDGNNYLVIWSMWTGPPLGILGAIVSPGGAVLRQIVVSSGDYSQSYPSVSFNPLSNQFFASWEDYRNLNWDIFGQLINADGILDGVNLPLAVGSESFQWYSDVAFDGNNHLVIWTELSGNSSDIYGARISPSGVVLDPNGKVIVATRNDEERPSIACSGFNCLLIYIQSDRKGTAFYGQLIIP